MMAFVNIVDSITMGSIVRSITQVLPPVDDRTLIFSPKGQLRAGVGWGGAGFRIGWRRRWPSEFAGINAKQRPERYIKQRQNNSR